MSELWLKFHWSLFLRVQYINILALVQIMAWHQQGDKPLTEAMLVRLPRHICATRPQWVNLFPATVTIPSEWIPQLTQIPETPITEAHITIAFYWVAKVTQGSASQKILCNGQPYHWIRSSDNDSTGFWPPGSMHILGADGYIQQRDWLFMWNKILCIRYILWGIPTIEPTFDVVNMVKTTTMKDVPINNDVLLNIQAC